MKCRSSLLKKAAKRPNLRVICPKLAGYVCQTCGLLGVAVLQGEYRTNLPDTACPAPTC